MRFTLADVIEGRRPPLCVTERATIGDALRLMLENYFGQLPVVDGQGTLRGIISHQSIAGLYYHTSGDINLLKLPLHHGMEPAVTLPVEADLLEAVDHLNTPGTYAVVVIRDDRPAGILTGKDMTRFFQTLFESLLVVEQIELTLENYITKAFPDKETMDAALLYTFGADPRHPTRPARDADGLSFADKMALICDDDNWPYFETVLGPMPLFMHLMDRVRRLRNQLAHFRGRPDALGHDALRRATIWLANRPAWTEPKSGRGKKKGQPTIPESDDIVPHNPYINFIKERNARLAAEDRTA